jgi:DNA primase
MGISIHDINDSVVHCFTCKWRGTLAMLVEEMKRCGAIEDEVAYHLNGYIAKMEEVPIEDILATLTEYDVQYESDEDELHPDSVLEPYAGKTHRYMLKRGLTLETLRFWESGFDSVEKRVTMPVRNWQGHLVGLTGRGIHGEIRPTYKNYWKFSKGRFLLGEHKAVRGTTGIIVEGPVDVYSVWQRLAEEHLLNQYSVVGIFGSDATLMQMRKIVKMFDDVILFMDNDSAGWDGRRRLGRSLQDQLLVRAIQYPNPVGGDPDEFMRTKETSLLQILEESQLFVLTD